MGYLVELYKEKPGIAGLFFCLKMAKRFRTGRAVFSEWHVCFRFWCRFLCLGYGSRMESFRPDEISRQGMFQAGMFVPGLLRPACP